MSRVFFTCCFKGETSLFPYEKEKKKELIINISSHRINSVKVRREVLFKIGEMTERDLTEDKKMYMQLGFFGIVKPVLTIYKILKGCLK